MYDNSRQRSAVLPLIVSTVGSALVGMVVRRMRADRATARADAAPGGDRSPRPGRPGRRTGRRGRGPVL